MRYLQIELHKFVDFHNSSFVTASVAVVRGTEDSDYVSLVRPIVPIHYQLVSSCNSGESIGMIELLRDVLTKTVTSTSWGDTPSTAIVGIGPEKITNWSLVGNFLDSVELSNLI